MALPARLPKPPKRSSRWRSQAHTNFVRSHGCCVPGCTGRPIEVAHVRIGSGAGMGQKPSDYFTMSLCRDHHAEQHRIGEVTFARRHGIDLRELVTAFIKASPRRAQIEREIRERAGG